MGQLAKEVYRRGWDVSVVSMLAGEGELSRELEAHGIQVRYLGMRRGIPDPRGVFRLATWLWRCRPDVLHSHMVHANLMARVTSLLVRGPVFISTVHNSIEGGKLLEFGYRITDRLVDLTTAISHAAAERYVRIGAVNRRRLRVVPNGIETNGFRSDATARKRVRAELSIGSAFCWLAAGRLTPQKDYPNLLAAFAKLPEPHAILLIAGEGELHEQLREFAGRLGIADRVRFLGFRSDIARVLNAADGYVMSSRHEGLPLVLLEAAACGLPIVATDVGGNREIIEDGLSGFLVPPGRSDLLASAMLQCTRLDSLKREQMTAAAHRHVSAIYGLDSIVDAWEEIYTQLIAQHAGHYSQA